MTCQHPEAASRQNDDDARLLRVVHDLEMELHPGMTDTPVRLDSLLDDELGLDSLALVELRAQLEGTFGVCLPDRVFDAATPGDWLLAVHGPRGPSRSLAPRAVASRTTKVPTDTGVSWPVGAETLLDALAWHTQNHPGDVRVRLMGK